MLLEPERESPCWSQRIGFGSWRYRNWEDVLRADPEWILSALNERQDRIPEDFHEELYTSAVAAVHNGNRRLEDDLCWLDEDLPAEQTEEEEIEARGFTIVSSPWWSVKPITHVDEPSSNATLMESLSVLVPLWSTLSGYSDPPTLRKSDETLANVFLFLQIKNAGTDECTVTTDQITLAFVDVASRLVFVALAFSVNRADSIKVPSGGSADIVLRFHVPKAVCDAVLECTRIRLSVAGQATERDLNGFRLLDGMNSEADTG